MHEVQEKEKSTFLAAGVEGLGAVPFEPFQSDPPPKGTAKLYDTMGFTFIHFSKGNRHFVVKLNTFEHVSYMVESYFTETASSDTRRNVGPKSIFAYNDKREVVFQLEGWTLDEFVEAVQKRPAPREIAPPYTPPLDLPPAPTRTWTSWVASFF